MLDNSFVRLTAEQKAALEKLKDRGWTPDLSTLSNLPCEPAVSVKCTAGSTAVIWFVIETDGYTHS